MASLLYRADGTRYCGIYGPALLLRRPRLCGSQSTFPRKPDARPVTAPSRGSIVLRTWRRAHL